MKAVFIDRDGVLNKRILNNYVTTVDELEWCPLALKSLRTLSVFNYNVFIITNQSAIGKKVLTLMELDRIHKKMIDEAKKSHAVINQIYYCPHLVEDNCDCRKPKGGMLLQAALEFGIDLTHSFMIGDSYTDIQAGKSIGAKTILVHSYVKNHERYIPEQRNPSLRPDWHTRSIWGAVNIILKINKEIRSGMNELYPGLSKSNQANC